MRLVLGISVAALLLGWNGIAPAAAGPVAASQAVAADDAQNAFNWEFGTWTTRMKIRTNPLSGAAPTWVAFEGTSVVKPLLNGRANFVELSVASANSKIEGGSLRLYNPKARQWSLNYANLGNGLLTSPVFGGFDKSGRGLFYGQDTLDGRTILVRFIVTRPSAAEAHFEQAYSTDGGQSWEDNWIAVDTKR